MTSVSLNQQSYGALNPFCRLGYLTVTKATVTKATVTKATATKATVTKATATKATATQNKIKGW